MVKHNGKYMAFNGQASEQNLIHGLAYVSVVTLSACSSLSEFQVKWENTSYFSELFEV